MKKSREKFLQEEIEKYQIKVGKQKAEIEELKKAIFGVNEVSMMFDAFRISMALKYGEEVKENDEFLGWNLTVPVNYMDVLKEYEVKTTKDGDIYQIGVCKK